MEPQLQQREEAGRLEGMQTALNGLVEVLRGFGHKDAEIKAIIMEKYALSEEDVKKYFS